MVTQGNPKTNRLGELEAAIMKVVWDSSGEVSVQQVQRVLQPTRGAAYTTVMTVMSRLADKGLLNRRKQGRAYLYTPAETRDEVGRSLLQSLVGRVYGGSTTRAIAHLIEADEAVDDEELQRLEELIRRKREGKGT